MLTIHCTIDVIHIGSHKRTLYTRSKVSRNTTLKNPRHSSRVEHRQTVIKRSLSTSASYSEETGNRPISFLIGCEHARNDRCSSFSLIIFIKWIIRFCWYRFPINHNRAPIIHSNSIISIEASINISRLKGTLNTQSHMETIIRQKSQTGRIGQSPVYFKGSTTR